MMWSRMTRSRSSGSTSQNLKLIVVFFFCSSIFWRLFSWQLSGRGLIITDTKRDLWDQVSSSWIDRKRRSDVNWASSFKDPEIIKCVSVQCFKLLVFYIPTRWLTTVCVCVSVCVCVWVSMGVCGGWGGCMCMCVCMFVFFISLTLFATTLFVHQSYTLLSPTL